MCHQLADQLVRTGMTIENNFALRDPHRPSEAVRNKFARSDPALHRPG